MKNVVLLSDIKEAADFSDQDLASILGVSKSRLKRKTTLADLRIDQLTRLSEELDCSVETFAQGIFDINVLKKEKTEPKLPARYQLAAFSRVRTSTSLLQFIETYFGKEYKNRILKTLQVNPELLNDLDQNISMRLVIDIANLLAYRNVKSTVLEKMGSFSAFANRTGKVGEFFSECRNTTEVYEKLIPVMSDFFERNHHYRILRLSKKECWIEAKTSHLVQDTLNVKNFGSIATCDIRRGIAGSFSMYVGHEVESVEHPLCMHRGDSSCVYRVIF